MPYKDPVKDKEYHRQWRLDNVDKHREDAARWTRANRASVNTKERERYNVDLEISRQKRIWRRYHVTQRQYLDILESQGGVCAICKNMEGRILCVDHDHLTGKVRGLLCKQCNAAVGLLGDDSETLHRAALYIDVAGASWGK